MYVTMYFPGSSQQCRVLKSIINMDQTNVSSQMQAVDYYFTTFYGLSIISNLIPWIC